MDNKPENTDPEILGEILKLYPKGKQSIARMLIGMTSTAVKLVSKTGDVSSKVGKTLMSTPERKKMVEEAGASLKDLREVAGLT